jgi:predicted ATPase
MIVSMIFDKSSVMLIEHPEDGTHRSLTKKVFSLLQTYTDPSQIIVSSHSPLVFDMLDPAQIRLVTMENGKTTARALTEEETAQARRYIKREGTLTEYLDVLIED